MAQRRIDTLFQKISTKAPSSDPAEILLNPVGDCLTKLEAAIKLLQDPDRRINQYLNFEGMDAMRPSLEAGKTILHLVIFHASNSAFSEALYAKLSEFFESLKRRNEDAEGESIFQPNYPIMSSSKFTGKLDLHMISMKKFFDETKFGSKRLQKLCKKNLDDLHDYYSRSEFDDESGDSGDDADDVNEGRYAPKYKKHLKELSEHIKGVIEASPSKKTEEVKGRNLKQYGSKYSIVPRSLNFGDEDSAEWESAWERLNAGELQYSDKAALRDMVVPLFHGVPLMQTQYTNYERRQIFDAIQSVNRKLMKQRNGEVVEFTPQEKALLTPHTRTATASAKLQSLYEMINATPEELNKLEQYENELLEYFRNHEFKEAFKRAMQIFIFSFGEDKTKAFWEKIQESAISDKELLEHIIKYRFPIIATSKTPDHALKFGIGLGIEEKRGEGQLNPWYNWSAEGVQAKEGFPYHRFAGLLYVTLNDLQTLQQGFRDGTIIDVNHALSAGLIGSDVSEVRFRNQLEVDFLGKMTGEVVAIIPIIYPYIRDGELDADYHEAIYGLNAELPWNSVDNPAKLREVLQKNAEKGEYNPALGNDKTFGKMIAHTFVDMANGAVLAATKVKKKFACTISEDKKLKPYNVHFDSETHTSKLSYASRDIGSKQQASKEDPTRAWELAFSESRSRKRNADCFDEDIEVPMPKKIKKEEIWSMQFEFMEGDPTSIVLENSHDPSYIEFGIRNYNIDIDWIRAQLSGRKYMYSAALEFFDTVISNIEHYGIDLSGEV